MMENGLIIGNQLIKLEEINSTNDFLHQYIKDHPNSSEGIVVIAKNQTNGRGQRGNIWLTESEKNLTFSFYLKPNIEIKNQFLISKLISVSIFNYLKGLNIEGLKIKWPNDIYVGDNKIAGILIENIIGYNKVKESIVGIGINVNQQNFNKNLTNPTSLVIETKLAQYDLSVVLSDLLVNINRIYVDFKMYKYAYINQSYIDNLFGFKENKLYKINGNYIEGEIVGVSEIGQLILNTSEGDKELDFKEIEYLF